MKKSPKFPIAVLISALILTSCGNGPTPPIDNDTSVESTDKSGAPKDTADTSEDTTTVPPVTSDDTTEKESDTTADTTAETTPPEPEEPEFFNPLTGLGADEDLSDKRPVAIMLSNIESAMPQQGGSQADIMYECIVEGYLTRLMMVTSDYSQLDTVGSIRSAREYYLDLAANHDAIFVHAGGSNQAYIDMKDRKVDHLDGVNMYIPNMFYRDDWRRENIGYTHSVVTDGERIVDGIDYVKCRTELARNFDSPLDFVKWGETYVPEESCTKLVLKYYGSHHPTFDYNEDDGLYYRTQFSGDAHSDYNNDEQLAFTNVIVLYTKVSAPKDDLQHVDVYTTGSGDGYYITAGGYEKITWKKTGKDKPLKLYSQDGSELLVNRGKTFFQICSTQMVSTTEIS